MIIKRSDEAIKNASSRGALSCDLPFLPGRVVIEDVQLQPPAPKLLFTASKVRPEGSFFFSYGIPGYVVTKPVHTVAVGLRGDVVTARLIYIAADGEFHSYEGDSGIMNFKYDAGEQRLSADFKFTAIDGERFEGEFYVVGYS